MAQGGPEAEPQTLQGVIGRIQKVVGQILDHEVVYGTSSEAAVEVRQAA